MGNMPDSSRLVAADDKAHNVRVHLQDAGGWLADGSVG